MARRGLSRLDQWLDRRALSRWTRLARGADSADLSHLEQQKARAQVLAQRIDRLIHVADSRLALPRIGSATFPRPTGTDWAWRPDLWRGPLTPAGQAGVASRTPIGDQVTVFHDCAISELTLRQLRNQRETDLAPFGLQMDVFRFDGSFLSLVLDLPDGATEGLKRHHLIRIDCVVEMEKPLEIFARLNVRHGPNTEQIVRELPLNDEQVFVAFDLAYTKLNEKRIEKAWIDLIFEGPQMNQITLRDLTFARYPRAAL
jgi:hypothetical protein